MASPPIRQASLEDWEEIWPLLRAMGRVDSAEVAQLRFSRIASSDDHLLVVAESDAGITGYAWANDRGPHLRSGSRTIRLNDLFVVPSHRRSGIGRALFERVRGWADQRGATWMEWQAPRDALAFYERLGYHGEACPDPGHPYFEIHWSRTS